MIVNRRGIEATFKRLVVVVVVVIVKDKKRLNKIFYY